MKIEDKLLEFNKYIVRYGSLKRGDEQKNVEAFMKFDASKHDSEHRRRVSK